METLLFTTVQNKSGKDIIAPVCLGITSAVMSWLLQYAATVSELRALFGGDQVTLGMTVVKISKTTFFLHFTSAADTNFTNNGSFRGGLFFMGFF